MAIGHQSFYQTQLTSSISDTDLVIPVDNPPIPSEGFLVIEGTVEAKREIIYYTSKDGTSVTCPSGAGNGRGYDGTTAVSHLQGAAVVMAPVGAMFDQLGDITVNSITIGGTPSAEGWSALGATPDTVTANGNKSYDLVFNGTDLTDTITEGMRIRTARTVTAPIQCATFDGTNDYFSKSSPAGMTFTDDFVVSAWVKLSSYPAVQGTIASRYNGTNGWNLIVGSTGQVYLQGMNAGSGNNSMVNTYQSLPLNKWVHVAAQLDMSAFTNTATTSYIMFDGVDVICQVQRFGTNPTALVQAGNLEIGSSNASSFFPGKIAQVAIYSAKVTQATILASMNQGLTGSETSLISAYSLSNSLEDLSANNNDLTANGGVLTTTSDSPFGNSGVSTTLDYGIVMAKSFSTNTTLTVQVPEGCTIPTSGGVATVDYSISDVPYGFVRDKGKWSVEYKLRADVSQTSPTAGTWYNLGQALTIPKGSWRAKYSVNMGAYKSGSTVIQAKCALSTTNNSATDNDLLSGLQNEAPTGTISSYQMISREKDIDLSVATPYYFNVMCPTASGTALQILGSTYGTASIKAENAYL